MKKALSIILAILMIAVSVPFAFAAESYEITHQPSSEELYVETNDENAAYQWCEVTKGYVIDNETATAFDPSVFGSDHGFSGESGYNEKTGWTPAYHQFPNGLFELYFFTVALKKGETITFEFSSDNMNPALLYELEDTKNIILNGNTGTFTAEEDGNYTLTATGFEGGTVKASSDGKKYTAIDGEISTQLNNIEDGKKYVCYVTFSDGTVVVSDEISGHNHTSAELTCMGYKCSVCGNFFGGETADVHSFTSYTQTVAPTCTEAGAETAECDYGCGLTDEHIIPATNHEGTLVEVEGKAATCTESGYKAYEYCTACDYTTYKEIPAAHTPVEEVRENEVAPDCENKGSYDLVVYCGACDEEIVRITIPVAALNHKDDDGDYKCDNGCGYEYEKPADPTPDEPAEPDTPDEPAEDNACGDCGKVHEGVFAEFICFFTKIIGFIRKLFA